MNRVKRLVRTDLIGSMHSAAVVGRLHAQAFEVTENDGSTSKKLLLVNKALEPAAPFAACGGVSGSCFRCVESTDGRDPWRAPVSLPLMANSTVSLGPFAVAILTHSACEAHAR